MTLSRRALIAASAARVVGIQPTSSVRSPLVATGSRFDAIRRRLDRDKVVDEAFWIEFRATADQLVAQRATNSEEYFAKARAAAWARLGDLDPPRVATLDIRIALSVLRDIILQNDPTLYESGALSRMYAELEEED